MGTHEKFVEYGKNAKRWIKKCALLLPEVERGRVWKKKGFSSLYEYAAKLACMSRRQVDDALWILRKVENRPFLRRVVEQKGINAVRPVISIVDSKNEQFWAAKAMEMSNNTLRTYVREFRDIPRFKPEKVKIVIEVDSEVAQELAKYDDLNLLMRELLALKRQKPPPVKENATRHIPNPIKNYILSRSNGKCEFPGCRLPSKILHHADRFALVKKHDPERIFALCKAHENICHLGLCQNEESASSLWQVRARPSPLTAKFEIDRLVQKFRKPG